MLQRTQSFKNIKDSKQTKGNQLITLQLDTKRKCGNLACEVHHMDHWKELQAIKQWINNNSSPKINHWASPKHTINENNVFCNLECNEFPEIGQTME